METILQSVADLGSGAWVYPIMESLARSIGSFSSHDLIFKNIRAVYNAFCPFCLSICVCICLWEILQKSFQAQRDLTINIIVGPLLKLLVSVIFMTYGLEIIGRVIGLSDYFVLSGLNLDSLGSGAQGESLDSGGFLIKVLLGIPFTIFGFIGTVIACVILAVQTLTAKIEVCLRACFLPIAIANITSEGPRGWSYIKKTMASALIIPGILICIAMASSVLEVFNADNLAALETTKDTMPPLLLSAFGNFLRMFVGPFSAIGAIATMKSLINEAVEG